MKVAIGSDHGGYKLKEKIKLYLKKKKIRITDFGTYDEDSVDYPDYARAVAKTVAAKRHKFGILVCGTGIGMSMTANKVKGVRAALCHNLFTVEMTRRHNDANVLALGGRVLKTPLALKMVDKFIKTKFDGGRHSKRVKRIER